jgi:hypothetical protein
VHQLQLPRQEELIAPHQNANPASALADGTGLFIGRNPPEPFLPSFMKKSTLLLTLLATSLASVVTPVVLAAEAHKPADSAKTAPAAKPGKLVRLTEKDAEWVVSARKAYPLKTCLTSDEELGSMGESPEYIYRVEGKPDRLVVFCCDGCNGDFLRDPAPYLAKLDAAKEAKAKAGAKKDGAHQGRH